MAKCDRTTKKQFRIFEKECRKWLDRLGLKDWCVFIRHEDLGNGKTLARCNWSATQRQAWLRLNVSTSAGDDEIKRAALHECLELLLYGCTDIMWESVSVDIVDAEIHKVIRTLENLLLEVKK